MNMLPREDQFDIALLLTLREEFQVVKAQMMQNELRLTDLENIIKELAKDIKKMVVLRTVAPHVEHLGEEVQKQHVEIDLSTVPEGDVEGLESNWSYVVAQKGGYNNILHLTVHELFSLGEGSIQFLTFLVQKREHEVKQRLRQLQAEYQKLQGSQLQEHFRELWKSHYALLKKKQSRTWKEEVFLESFDAFIAWIQQ